MTLISCRQRCFISPRMACLTFYLSGSARSCITCLLPRYPAQTFAWLRHIGNIYSSLYIVQR